MQSYVVVFVDRTCSVLRSLFCMRMMTVVYIAFYFDITHHSHVHVIIPHNFIAWMLFLFRYTWIVQVYILSYSPGVFTIVFKSPNLYFGLFTLFLERDFFMFICI